jgi:hypothetical protein
LEPQLVPIDFHYRFSEGASHSTLWEVSLLLDTEDETLSLAADFRHTIAGVDQKDVLWTLEEVARHGPDVALPPYLQSGVNQFPMNSKGVPAPGYAVPCFLLPAFPDQALAKESEWTVEDASSGSKVLHVFTVLEQTPELLRVVGDAGFESNDLEVEIGGDYNFDPRRGVLVSAKIAIESFRPGLTRSLTLQISPES